MKEIKRKNNLLILVTLCVLFFLICIVSMSSTYSKYVSFLTGGDTTNVGLFVVKDIIEDTLNVDLQSIDPDNPITYTFYIRNYDERGTSEVNMKYSLSFKTEYGNLPLEYTLYKGDVENNILDENNTYTDSLYYNKKEEIKYTLIINMSSDDYAYQGMLDIMNIDLEAVQID